MRTCADVDMLFVILSKKLIGTGHYLSPWERGRGEDFRRDHLIFRRTKWGISRNRTQKARSLKTLEGFRGGTSQICLENEDMGGGDRQSHQRLLGGITSMK